MKIGYARVSTISQKLETQKDILKKEGCEVIFVEKTTAASTAQRKELKLLIKHVREGDIVVVTKIDRLARSIIDLNSIVTILNKKGVSIKFINENIEFNVINNSNNVLQMLLFNILGAFAQFERDMIVERTSEGRERAKKEGRHLGRPSRPKKDIERALKLYKERDLNKMSVSDISKVTQIPRSTIYNELKKQQ